MSLLSVSNLEKAFGADVLFTGVSFRLEWRAKLGLIGRNGTGKTTLLRILTRQDEQDRGNVAYENGVRFGYLKQEDNVIADHTVLEEAEAAFAVVRDAQEKLRAAEHAMAAATEPEEVERALEAYTLLHDRYEAMGGYEVGLSVPGVLAKLGFTQGDMAKACGNLSGGEKTRLAIARLLLSQPDVLLLDEPTNHLDIEATEWLESFLRDYGGAVVLVSHDRYFLDRVATQIAEIERTKLTVYPGNYSAFLKLKEASRLRQAETFEREQAEIARLVTFFEKWKNTPSKKNQAVMRMRWAERIRETAVDKPAAGQKSMALALKAVRRSGEDVVVLEKLTKRYGDRTLFENVNALIQRGDRVGVIGPNGAGKSTLVKLILGKEQPTSGSSQLGVNISYGYFAQDTSELDYEASVIENLLEVTDLTPEQARTHLGRFLFTGEDVFRPVSMLSGGEKNKLVLAQLMLVQPNLLILDEPTNHLDIDSRDAIIESLEAYRGTLLLVSHDRYLLDKVATKILSVDQGKVTVFEGTYTEFRESTRPAPPPTPVRSKTKGSRAQPHVATPERSAAGLNAHQLSKERQRANSELSAAEHKVAGMEARLKEIEEALALPSDGATVAGLANEYASVQASVDLAIEAWQSAAEYAQALGDMK